MALEATHIRFALDIIDKYNIENIEKYISGSIYPDSRYVTKINREYTHNNDILHPEFANTDFKKGWQAHQVCDNIFNTVCESIFSDILSKYTPPGNENDWITSTGIKIVLDMSDMQKMNIQEHLLHLEYIEKHHDEDLNKVRDYNQLIISLYKDKSKTTLDDYTELWTALEIRDDLQKKIILKADEFLQNDKIATRIENLYEEMLDHYQQKY